MNAPPTFESFLLYEGEKKWVELWKWRILHVITANCILQDHQGAGHKSTECCYFHSKQGRSHTRKHDQEVSNNKLFWDLELNVSIFPANFSRIQMSYSQATNCPILWNTNSSLEFRQHPTIPLKRPSWMQSPIWCPNCPYLKSGSKKPTRKRKRVVINWKLC